jgi:peroxiredoxin
MFGFGLKSYNYDAFTKDLLMKDVALDRFSGPEPGDEAPNFEARTLNGDRVRLSDFEGEKNVVLTFGSATCPFTAATISGMNDLYDEHSGADVQFLFCYVREAHPGERLAAHHEIGDKVRAAEHFRDEEEVEMPVIVDDLKGTVHKRYGKLPNSTFIIDKGGRIAFRCLWTRPGVIEEALEELIDVQQERGVDHAVVHGGEDTKMPSTYAMLHAHRALERGGHRAIHDFRTELGLPGAMAVTGSRIVQPVVENPGKTLAAAAITAGVITGGIIVGRILRQKRFQVRSPYDINQAESRWRRRDPEDTGGYEAVGI